MGTSFTTPASTAAIIAGLGALAGFNGNPTKSTGTTSNITNPNFSPGQAALQQSLLNSFQQQITNAPNWNKAYEINGTNNILKNALASAQNANDITSARGIARTTAGAQALNDQSQQQSTNLASFLNNAPIAEQTNLTNLQTGAGNFVNSIPTGSTSNGTTTGTANAPANPLGSALTGGATAIAGLLGQQAANSSLNNILKGLGLGSAATPGIFGNSNPLNGLADIPNNNLGDVNLSATSTNPATGKPSILQGNDGSSGDNVGDDSGTGSYYDNSGTYGSWP